MIDKNEAISYVEKFCNDHKGAYHADARGYSRPKLNECFQKGGDHA